jgi:calcium-dependent protein kinase
MYIITELCDGGDLFEYILNKDNLTEFDAAYIMNQLLRSINYVTSIQTITLLTVHNIQAHKNDIMHRDLKPENILIDKTEDNNYHIKVIDWGVSIKSSFQ